MVIGVFQSLNLELQSLQLVGYEVADLEIRLPTHRIEGNQLLSEFKSLHDWVFRTTYSTSDSLHRLSIK
jgi:hypothetical protein